MNIGIIGAGNLGKALIDCLLKQDVPVLASSRRNETYNGLAIQSNNKCIVKKSDIVVIAVKPSSVAQVLNEIKNEIHNKLVISFVAGIRLEYYESIAEAKFLRAMTNLGVMYNQGFSAYKIGRYCDQHDNAEINKFFDLLGQHSSVEDEFLLDAATGISGSGIAYILKIIGVFLQSAQEHGFSEDDADKIVLGTIKGAISLIENSNLTIEELITLIASTGGTTEQGLNKLSIEGLSDILKNTIRVTVNKSKNIGEHYE